MGERKIVMQWSGRQRQPGPALFKVDARVEYRAQWRAFAWRRALALILVSGWAPVAAGLFTISRLSVHQPLLFTATILGWLGAAIVAVWWAGEFRCPRCCRRYGAVGHGKGRVNLTRGLFDTICGNCKLRKFEQAS